MHRLALIGWTALFTSKSHSFSLFSPTAATVKVSMAKEEFLSKYLRRLKLDPSLFLKDKEASIEKLRLLQEAHLAHIPFENLSQHGCSDPATVLNLHSTEQKILHKHRGGFCFELNGLFAELLIQLGYTVGRVPARVYRDPTICADVATHLILMVQCSNAPGETWFVDVGFGEPPLHPLRYDQWDQEQVTPEGMQSKICHQDEDVTLYWWSHANQSWLPRLKWNHQASLLLGETSLKLADFAAGLAAVQDPASIFSQKLICCRITREKKYTVAGNRFKTTGSPRFPEATPEQDAAAAPPVHIRSMASPEELRAILRDQFDIPMEASEGVELQSSLAADPMIWSHM
jgi:N-hydroxyarylamine O-acetyltransferase